ncbi:MAG: hypothetical protein A2252_04060 [Elusimicrobia bacterium RIFOXYA2_FULL_39_19]|nr:MAG: hypothetical protein A2252_04060 [Elusimicrobia bacterium RIFOXYA2_FULL_39_19]
MKKILFAILLLVCASLEARELTWEDVLKEAKQNNPSLKKAQSSLQQAEINYSKSWANFLPQVSASASTGRSGSNSSSGSTSNSIGVSASISLFSGFSDTSELSARNKDLEIEKMRYTRSLSDIIYNLKKSFITLLFAQESVQVSQKILERRTLNFELISVKYESGREDKGSFLRVEADKLQAEYDLKKAKRNLDVITIQLLKDMGIGKIEPITVIGDLSALPEAQEVKINEIIKNVPEYIIAQDNLEKAHYDIVSAKSVYYPGVSLSGGVSESGSSFPLDSNSWNARLGISLPLYTGGKNKYNLQTAKQSKLILDNTFKETVLNLYLKLNSYWNDLINSIDNAQLRQKYLDASSEQSKINSQKYLNGLVTYNEWYSSENDYISSQRSLLDAKRDRILSEALWHNALGREE